MVRLVRQELLIGRIELRHPLVDVVVVVADAGQLDEAGARCLGYEGARLADHTLLVLRAMQRNPRRR